MTPAQQLKLLTERLQIARKGIILLHDPKAQTAAMLPAFLRYLRDNRYRVVHLVPAGAKPCPTKHIRSRSLRLKPVLWPGSRPEAKLGVGIRVIKAAFSADVSRCVLLE